MTLVLFSRSQPFLFTARCYASAVLAMALCPSVSVTSRCSIETVGRIELVFGMWASFQPSYTVLKGNSVISKTKGTSLWKFLNSGLRKFRHGISIVETCYQLSSRKVDAQSVINWTVVRQLSRKYLRRSTTIVYRTDRQALSTARFCCTGQLPTADTWFRTCSTSSFCTVAWQLAKFQLTRRIARSLGDSWASSLLQDWLHGFPRLFTVTSKYIHFYFLVFLFSTF